MNIKNILSKITWLDISRATLLLTLLLWNALYLFGIILDPYGLRPEEVFSQGLHAILLLSSAIPLLPFQFLTDCIREIGPMMLTTTWFTIILDICHIVSYRQTQQHFHFRVIIAGLILDLLTLLVYSHYFILVLSREAVTSIRREEENLGPPAICSLCFQKPESKLTTCGHRLCTNCFDDLSKGGETATVPTCPFCKSTVTKCKDLVVKAARLSSEPWV